MLDVSESATGARACQLHTGAKTAILQCFSFVSFDGVIGLPHLVLVELLLALRDDARVTLLYKLLFFIQFLVHDE